MKTDVLAAAVRRERRAREDDRREVLGRLNAALSSMAGRYDVEELYAFGSVLREGWFTRDSDVDVAVASLGQKYWSFAAELSEALGREVDVVDLDSSPLAARIRAKGERWIPRR